MADQHPSTQHADHDADAYVHGTMTIEEQTSTYTLFMNLAKWGSLSIAATLLFLVLWFNPNGNFFTGLIGAVVLFAAGAFALKGKKASH